MSRGIAVGSFVPRHVSALPQGEDTYAFCLRQILLTYYVPTTSLGAVEMMDPLNSCPCETCQSGTIQVNGHSRVSGAGSVSQGQGLGKPQGRVPSLGWG